MKAIEHGTITLKKGLGMREGVWMSGEGKQVEITVWAKEKKNCNLCLYKGGHLWHKIPMFSMAEEGADDLFSVVMEGENLENALADCEYCFEADKERFSDPYMVASAGRDVFGKSGNLRGRFVWDTFDWSGENRVPISYEDMVLYQCHLRGFTKHSSSGVSHPGTFSGFVEKLDYIKDLGVNTLLFLPLYDFNECMDEPARKLNYWGYTKDACYFAPKASYASCAKNAVTEMKQLVKEVHRRGMNFMMEIHFVGQSPAFILRCLRYYAVHFHVDGFLVDSSVVSGQWLEEDPVLRQCKFFGNYWENPGGVKENKKFASLNDGFLTVARRYLKSDEGQVADFYHSFKADAEKQGMVHYITQKNGFTLRDLVSYDVKHNEANGEKNADGTEYNYSWNCGQEGESRKKSVKAMRLLQTKNAFCMVLLGRATPMILAGDEFGRTQKGNNNAYCLDNATTWLDWNLLKKNKEVYEFVKALLAFRKTCPLYQRVEPLLGMDTKGVGAPDVSAHGKEPWEADFSYYSRELGILFYGSYYEGNSVYMAFNFHWDAHEFYLPVVGHEETWQVLFDTARPVRTEGDAGYKKYTVSPRSVVVFESRPLTKGSVERRQKKKGKTPE